MKITLENKAKHFPTIVIDDDFHATKMSIFARGVYVYLWHHCKGVDSDMPPITQIADALSISSRTVIRALKELEDRNFLSVKRSNGKRSHYDFSPKHKWKAVTVSHRCPEVTSAPASPVTDKHCLPVTTDRESPVTEISSPLSPSSPSSPTPLSSSSPSLSPISVLARANNSPLPASLPVPAPNGDFSLTAETVVPEKPKLDVMPDIETLFQFCNGKRFGPDRDVVLERADVQRIYDYWKLRGFRTGNTAKGEGYKIKDWHAFVRNWAGNKKRFST